MMFVSVTQATTRLGIDAKTLHRWLREAQLPLEPHRVDGRKKGVSEEHLQVLARLHQRRLAVVAEEPAAPVHSEGPLVPAELLALPEQLSALQAQMAALQQQVAELTRLLQAHELAPATPAAVTPPARASRGSSKPAAPRPRRVAKAPRKPVHVIPRVEYSEQGHYVVICPRKGLLPIRPDTPEWFAWVREQSSFRFVGKCGHFTAHHWWRVPRGAWRAHRHIRNHNYVLRLAPNHELTLAVLERAAAELQAHLSE